MPQTAPWSAPTDEEIVGRVQQGDGKLFSLIFERHYPRLERYLRHLGVAESELEDVLAETFTRAFARIDSFNAASGVRYISYLYAIARNLVTDRLRSRMRAPELLSLDDIHQEADPLALEPAELVLRRAEVERIRAAMTRLSHSDREIITLSYDHELSCREIMQVMGKPSITSVTTHLYKAMKRLRELVRTAAGAHDMGGGANPR
jgi:RNA polymerase sigma factor (sigma-70 family)